MTLFHALAIISIFTWSGLCLFGEEDFTQGQVDFIKAERVRMETRINTMSKQDVKEEDVALVRLLLDHSSDGKVCRDKVISKIRAEYASAPSPYQEIMLEALPRSLSGELAVMLCVFKDNTDGLYEYTKITGRRPSKIDRELLNADSKYNRAAFMQYVIYSFRVEAFQAYLEYKRSGILSAHPQRALEIFARLFADKKDARQFLVDYPFIPGSSIAFGASGAAAVANTSKDPNGERASSIVFQEYMDKVLDDQQNRIDFLCKFHGQYGNVKLIPLLLHFVEQPGFIDLSLSIKKQTFALALAVPLIAVQIAQKTPDVSYVSIIDDAEKTRKEELGNIQMVKSLWIKKP